VRRVLASQARNAEEQQYRVSLQDKLAFALFAVAAVLTFSAVKLAVGPVPVRLVALLASGFLLLATDPGFVAAAVKRFGRILLVITLAAGFAILGSVLAGTTPAVIATQVVELHLQAIVATVITGTLAQRFGVRPVAVMLVAAFATTAVVAVGQALGLDAAWNARAILGQISNDPVLPREIYEQRERAMGMSYSPVVFGTQSCAILALLLSSLLAARNGEPRRFNVLVLAACAVIAVLSLATGNRSPLLGMAVFLASYLLVTRLAIVFVVLPLTTAGLLVAQPVLERMQESDVRAVRTDSSSENRAVLREYGAYLVSQRPLGYGLDFDSTEYSEEYTDQVKYTPSPGSIRKHALHNYYLMFLGKHGLLVLLLLPLVLPRTRKQLRAWWAFTPYMIHIFYHNDGPLQGDNVFFFVIPLAVLLAGEADSSEQKRPKRWRRAFEAAPA
jgi:hypothetical protein